MISKEHVVTGTFDMDTETAHAVCTCGWKTQGKDEDRVERKSDQHLLSAS